MSDIGSLLNVSNEWISPSLDKIFADARLGENDVTVKASMYSVLAGGKRFRPALMYYSAKMLGFDVSKIESYATALEMIHTYSLIHDDLPAMDNDDLRRGKPTCHKAFGEDIAILAGDCLLNRAFEILMKEAIKNYGDINTIKAAMFIGKCSGIDGMVGGQSIDLASEGLSIDIDRLKLLQELKTGALIKAAVVVPAILSGASEEIIFMFEKLSDHIGLAFQIKDDLLDFESDAQTLGKSTGKDLRDNKSTFVTLLGIDGAKSELIKQKAQALDILDSFEKFDYSTENYRIIIDYLVNRIN